MTKIRRIRRGDTIDIPRIGQVEIDQLLDTQASCRDKFGRKLGQAPVRTWLKKYL